jgi:futalosine hydrolase
VNIALITATAMEMRAALAGILPSAERAELNGPDEPAKAERSAQAGILPLAKKDAPDEKDAPAKAERAARANLPPPGGIWLPALRLERITLLPVICGVGPLNAALALGRLADKNPAGVVNLGLAGSYDLLLAPLGSLLAASEEIWPEYGLVRREKARAEALGLPLAEQNGRPVFDRIALTPVVSLEIMGLDGRVAAKQGPAVTVAGASGAPERARRLQRRTGGLMENMEGFALALGCLGLKIPFAEIRSISNPAGLRPPQGWDMPLALAGLGGAARLLFPSPPG